MFKKHAFMHTLGCKWLCCGHQLQCSAAAHQLSPKEGVQHGACTLWPATALHGHNRSSLGTSIHSWTPPKPTGDAQRVYRRSGLWGGEGAELRRWLSPQHWVGLTAPGASLLSDPPNEWRWSWSPWVAGMGTPGSEPMGLDVTAVEVGVLERRGCAQPQLWPLPRSHGTGQLNPLPRPQ